MSSRTSDEAPSKQISGRRRVSLTVGQIMYLLAATDEPMEWGQHRRANVRARLLAVLEPHERNGIES